MQNHYKKQMIKEVEASIKSLVSLLEQLKGEAEVSFMLENLPPEQLMIQSFIDDKVGNFAADMLTATEMMLTLEDPQYRHLSKMNEGWFTPQRVGRVTAKMRGCINQVAAKGTRTARVWIVRDHVKYLALRSSDLYDEYEAQRENPNEASFF